MHSATDAAAHRHTVTQSKELSREIGVEMTAVN